MVIDAAFLNGIPFFQPLDEQERTLLAGLLEVQHFPAGKLLFRFGDPGDALYIVRSGHIEVFVENTVGERIVLAGNSPGDIFGEVSLLDGGPRTATAEATQDSDVVVMDRGDLVELVRQYPHAGLVMLAVMGQRLRATNEMVRAQTARNANVEDAEHLTFGGRVADRVAAFGGSWTFIIIFAVVLAGWIVINSWALATKSFDPYPYILMNLILSTLAAIQAPVIMMSQNRQASKDRLKADLEYEVNLRAELEIAHLHTKVDRIYEEMQAHFARRDRPKP
jgi:CRP/FNR family cyclic AMP-dependent transcriptional regulator